MTDDEILTQAMDAVQELVLRADDPLRFLDELIAVLLSKQLPKPCRN